MDAAERALLDETSARALVGRRGASADAALADLGWLEMLAAEPRDAIDIVFNALGAANAHRDRARRRGRVGARRDAARRPRRAAPAVRRVGRARPARRRRCHALGLATAASPPRAELLVVCAPTVRRRGRERPGRVRRRAAVRGHRPRRRVARSCGWTRRGRGRRRSTPRAWDAARRRRPARGRAPDRRRVPSDARPRPHATRWTASSSGARSRRSKPFATGSRKRSSRSRRSTRRCSRARPTSRTRCTAALGEGDRRAHGAHGRPHCQQVLAGIGFTTDHPFHRFLKRTMVLDGLFGIGRRDRRRRRPAPARRRAAYRRSSSSEEGAAMTDFDAIDFFRDNAFVADPYPYFEHLRGAVPGAARAAPRRGDGHRIRRGDRGVPRHRDVLVVQLGDRTVPRLPGPARRRRRRARSSSSTATSCRSATSSRRSTRRCTPRTARC